MKTITAKPSAVRGTITAGRTCEALEVLEGLPADTVVIVANGQRTAAELVNDSQYAAFKAMVCQADPATVMTNEVDDAKSIISIAEQSRSMSPAAVLAWGGTLGLAVTAGIFIAAQRAR